MGAFQSREDAFLDKVEDIKFSSPEQRAKFGIFFVQLKDLMEAYKQFNELSREDMRLPRVYADAYAMFAEKKIQFFRNYDENIKNVPQDIIPFVESCLKTLAKSETVDLSFVIGGAIAGYGATQLTPLWLKLVMATIALLLLGKGISELWKAYKNVRFFQDPQRIRAFLAALSKEE